ncbi:MAG: hypothetical protein HZB38_12845 [Planctomycetes bacterium]|nr:hypothetical protein [Planctomycetota bacterium]
MNNRILTAILVAALARPVLAQTYEINWYTMDNGGAVNLTSTHFVLSGTLGQSEAGQPMHSASYQLTGGYWAGTGVSQAPCIGDLNGDRIVDLTDLTTLLSNFGTSSGAVWQDGDSDGDGDVDLPDLTSLLSAFGSSC